jgi:hypothetical protein
MGKAGTRTDRRPLCLPSLAVTIVYRDRDAMGHLMIITTMCYNNICMANISTHDTICNRVGHACLTASRLIEVDLVHSMSALTPCSAYRCRQIDLLHAHCSTQACRMHMAVAAW